MRRDRAHLGREFAGEIPGQFERWREKTLREIKGPRSPLLWFQRGSWHGGKGSYDRTAFLQASGGGGGWKERRQECHPRPQRF